MKKYIAKYLPDNSKGYKIGDVLQMGLSFNKVLDEEDIAMCEKFQYQKVKLYLCSKEQPRPDHHYYSPSLNKISLFDYYDATIISMNMKGDEIMVLGRISDNANWVKEWDEFDEEDFRWMCDDGSDDMITVEKLREYAKADKVYFNLPFGDYAIKGPCGHFH